MKLFSRLMTISLVSLAAVSSAVQASNSEASPEFLNSALFDEMGVSNVLSGRATLFGDKYDSESADAKRKAIDFVYGLGGNFVGRWQDNAGNQPAMRSEVYVDLGLDIKNPNDARVLERISIDLGLSFQDAMSDLLEPNTWEGVYSTGLTEKRARDVLNKLMLLANVYTIHGLGDWEVPIFVGIGRDDAAMIGSFIPQTLLVTESALTTYSREQMDQVRVAAKIGNTYVEANIYGKQWLGDYTTGTLAGLSQDSDSTNFAINILHELALGKNKIGLKFSYINEGQGTILTRATNAEQIGANQTINFGANFAREIEVGTIYFGAEALYVDPKNSDQFWGASALAALEFNNGITPFVAYEMLDQNGTDWAATLGAAFQLVHGLVISAGVQFVNSETQGNDTAFFVGATLGAPQNTLVLSGRE
jgi:hypothetical protein